MTDANDKDLLLAFTQRADEPAFATLVGRHANLVFGTALRLLGDRETAEEVAQNVFATLARKARWLTGEGGLAGWLYRTTVLEVRFRQRTEARRRQREQTAIDLGTAMKPEDSLLKSLGPLLDEGLMELSEKDRHAVISRFFEGRSFREVGAALGTGEDAAQKRVSKGLEQLTRFFRRRGYPAMTAGIVAHTLEAACTLAPVDLVTQLVSGALTVAATSSLTTAGMFIAKFMSLTKLQTASLCLLLSAGPVSYQWNAAEHSRNASPNLRQQLIQIERDIDAERRQQAHWQRRLHSAEEARAGARRELVRLRDVIASTQSGGDAGLYLWSEDSEYVRLPKVLAKNIFLSGSHEMTGAFPVQHEQEAPILPDGSVSGAMTAALEITPEEQEKLSSAFAQLGRDFREADAGRTYVTNRPPSDFGVGDRPSYTVVTQAASPAETEAMRENFRAQLVSVLGEERTGVVWQQAKQIFAESFNDFGALERVQTVAREQGDAISTWSVSRRVGETGFVSWGNSAGHLTLESIPEKLRPAVEEWRRNNPKSLTSGPLP